MNPDHKLEEALADKDPFVQFEKWYNENPRFNVREPEAMVVSTVNELNRPSARVVLLRGFDRNGFVFYTNYKSRKGAEISGNPYACLTFYWPEAGRQVRIEGKLNFHSAEASDAYFQSRPRESCIGAWASTQSETIASREELEKKVEQFTRGFDQKPVERPSWWGGYILVPEYFEFWQGRESRLHDRLAYSLDEEKNWKIRRLSP